MMASNRVRGFGKSDPGDARIRESTGDIAGIRRRAGPVIGPYSGSAVKAAAVFMHENRNQGLATPFALTHNS